MGLHARHDAVIGVDAFMVAAGALPAFVARDAEGEAVFGTELRWH